jgi:HSP20 family protein
MRGMTPETSRALELLRRRLYPLLEGGSGPAPEPPRPRAWTPPADVRATDTEVLVTLELPGLPREAIDVTLTGSTLTVSGERPRAPEDADRVAHQAERPYGAFSRSFTLPWALAEEGAAAALVDGVLTVRMRRRAS